MPEKKKEQVLSVRDLDITFKTTAGPVHAIRGVNIDLYKGETVALVGESGSGMNTIKRNIGRIFTSLIFIILITFLSPRLIPPLNPPFESRYFKIYWDAYTLFES